MSRLTAGVRHSATRSLLTRRDVIVVASVSCIYGIGSVEAYTEMTMKLFAGQALPQRDLIKKLVELQYRRNDIDFARGMFRGRRRRRRVDLLPAHYEDTAWRIAFFGDEIESIKEFDPLTGETKVKLQEITIFANSHYVTPMPTIERAIKQIKIELKERLDLLHKANKLVEAQRLEQRTTYDLEMLVETGSCKGIENYSRWS